MYLMECLAFSTVLLLVKTTKVAAEEICGSYMIIGGKDKTSVEFLPSSDINITGGKCDSFANAPFPTQNAVALRNREGQPTICGGSQNPDPRSCHVYDIFTNTWSQGPNMKQIRIGATATCLSNGECWVFGGIGNPSKDYAEWYNPATKEFELGPQMPVHSLYSCSVVGPYTGLIYLTAATRKTETTRLFTFDPTTKLFTELLPPLDVARFHSACAVLVDESVSEHFYLVGGGISPSSPSANTYIYDTRDGSWYQGQDYPTKVYAPSSIPNPDYQYETFGLVGGITSDNGTESKLAAYYESEFGDFLSDHESMEARSYAPALLVPNVCPEATEKEIANAFANCG